MKTGASRESNIEVIQGPVTPAQPDRWMEMIAWLMDSAIPLGRWSIGLDGLIGMIPGFGDMIGALISMLIVMRSMQAGVPRVAVARMLTNIAIDALVGAVPIFGDAFDFAYKSNLKNVEIYRQSVYGIQQGTAHHWLFFIGVGLLIAAIVAVPVLAVMLLVRILPHW
jgi:hypothetical protein